MKKILAFILIICLCLTQAFALDLITEEGIGSYVRKGELQIADGTDLHINTVLHQTAGQNEERYIEYTPGSDVLPVVSYGSVLYGMSTISYVADFNKAQGKSVVAGINGDFFFTDSGIPIGMVVTDGILRCSDSGQNAIGFFADGSAMIGKPALSIHLSTDTGYKLKVDYVNKVRRNYGVYLMTPDYSANTRVTTEGTTIVLKNISGDLRIGGTITATVDSVIKGSAPVNLPQGTMVLTAIEENGLAARLDGVAASSQVTISVTSPDARWGEVISAVGAGDRLVTSGQVAQGLAAGAAPRTAFGITAEGKLVFYTVDGRQAGYSSGMNMTTLAQRMISLGCVDAVNLDGGGSTVMVTQYPGMESLETINKPSDGSQRRGANYILFLNTAEKENPAAVNHLHLYPHNPIVLANASIPLQVKATDLSYYPAQLPAQLQFSTGSALGSVDNTGIFTAGNTEGRLEVTVTSNGITGKTPLTIIQTPTAISLTNAKTGAAVQSLSAEPGQTIDLNAVSSFHGLKVHSTDASFRWEILNEVGEIGTVDSNGVFAASMIAGSRGKIVVAAGERKIELPVTVGSADRTIDSFENAATSGLTAGDAMIRSSIHTNKENVQYGNGSGMIVYDFNAATEEVLMLPTSWKVPNGSKYLKFWLSGDNSGNLFGLVLRLSDGSTSYLPVCSLDFSGYTSVAAELPAGITEISSLYVRKSGRLTGTIYLDQMSVSYQPEMDQTPPEIQILSTEADSLNDSIRLLAKITDNGYLPMQKQQITLLLDGVSKTFQYNDLSAELTASLSVPKDGILHRITIKVADAAGNISTASVDTDLHVTSEPVFADTSGHWSEKYAVYLSSQGVINGVLREDGRYFLPDQRMTRAEFAVMMTKYLGLNLADYAGIALPYADIDNIPVWARDSIAAMYQLGVIMGKNSGGNLIFDPNSPITRAQVITVLGRTLPKGLSSSDITFEDSGTIPDYAKSYVGILLNMHVLTGYTDNTIRPNKDVNRSEAVKMLYGLY